MTDIQYHQTGAIKKTFGMVKHMKSQQFLNVDTEAYQLNRMTMTLIGMTIFTHRITRQNLNPRYLLGDHHQDGPKE